MVITWAIQFPINMEGRQIVKQMQAKQSARLELERADLKQGECISGRYNGMYLVRSVKEYNSGDRQTTILGSSQWYPLSGPTDEEPGHFVISFIQVNISSSASKTAAIYAGDLLNSIAPGERR